MSDSKWWRQPAAKDTLRQLDDVGDEEHWVDDETGTHYVGGFISLTATVLSMMDDVPDPYPCPTPSPRRCHRRKPR